MSFADRFLRAQPGARTFLLPIVLGIALASAGCGSSSKSSGSPSSSVNSACDVAAANAAVSKALTDKSNPYPTNSVDGSLAKGKSYWIIPLTTAVPTIVNEVNGYVAAAQAAGAKATIFDGKGSPATVVQGFNSAITAKADGIVLLFIDPVTVQPSLAAAAAAKIPVIDGINGLLSAPFAAGQTGRSTYDEIKAGTLAADYAVKLKGCDLNAVVVGSAKESAASLYYSQGVTKELERICTNCKLEEIDVAPADIATKLIGLTQTTLQRNPKINLIISASDSAYVPGISAALTALNLTLPIVSFGGQNIQEGQKGGNIKAETISPPGAVVGWYLFDATLRAQSGKTGFATEMPVNLVDSSNWGSDPDVAAILPQYKDYQAKFKALWGIS